MRLAGKIGKTLSAAAFVVMFAVPAMASTASQNDLLTGKVLANAINDTVLLVRGGNGNGKEGNGSDNGTGEGDRSRSGDRDRSCVDNAPATANTGGPLFVGNSKGSKDQTQDRQHEKNASCQS